MDHEDILHRCFRCGYCKLPGNYVDINCPSYLAFRFETYSPGGRMWLLRAWLDGKIEAGNRFADIMFSCAACGNCVAHCAFPEFRDRLLSAFTAGREALLDAGVAPSAVRNYLTTVQRHGNPYGRSVKKAERLGLPAYDHQDYLLFIDDAGTYDPRGREMARSVGRILERAGISFGVIDGECLSDGNDVRATGETLLFENLARHNIGVLNTHGVRKIITLSPHSFHALKNDYPALGGTFAVFHYTQVLAFAMAKLTVTPPSSPLRVTFHDPCYLGRHNGDYVSARTILKSLPGLTLTDMDRSGKNALCCGGGGGNFFTDLLTGGAETSARVRVREAASTGADILAVACPLCAVMLEDAVKSENLDHTIRVMEVSELVDQCL
ncbi:hypothetical protein JCM14469_01070 [Desulfatiferula olefinivorans]